MQKPWQACIYQTLSMSQQMMTNELTPADVFGNLVQGVQK